MKNCYFNNGVFYVKYNTASSLSIENSYFQNNSGFKGAVFYIENVRSDYNNDIIISSSIFENNNVEQYGGVIFSSNKLYNSTNDTRILFKDCDFKNNTSKKGNDLTITIIIILILMMMMMMVMMIIIIIIIIYIYKQGDISYSYSLSDEPYFTNIDDLRKIENAFATNPSHLEFLSDSLKDLSIFSGEMSYDEIKCNKMNTLLIYIYTYIYINNLIYLLLTYIYIIISLNVLYKVVIVDDYNSSK